MFPYRGQTYALGVHSSSEHGADIGQNWSRHDYQFAGDATRAERADTDIDFGSELMRLAVGGAGGTLGGDRLDGQGGHL